MGRNTYGHVWTAEQVIESVEHWVGNQGLVFRECGGLPGPNGDNGGRIDVLIVPTHRKFQCICSRTDLWFWDRFGLVGVEVKVDRADFLKGLKSGQYERYAEALTGVYIATPRNVCKTDEIPAMVGHLVVGRRSGYGPVAVCRSHPIWVERQIPQDYMWRLILRMAETYRENLFKLQQKYRAYESQCGKHVARPMIGLVEKLARNIADELSAARG